MESVIELKDRAWDERTLAWVLTTGIQDGGQWDMLCAVVKKYGVVPQSVFPDAYQARNTRDMNKLINRRLRRFASDVKAADSDEAISTLKETALKELYGFLCTCFGVPPQSFSFDVVDKDGKYIREDNLTPHSFYEKYVGVNLDDYVSIIHSPTVDKPYYQTFTVSYLGNVTDVPVTYLNLPLDEFKKCVISQLSDQEIVWFGSDCGNYIDRPHGVWDERSFDLNALFNIDFTIDKETSLYSWDSAMNHAMVLTGVNLIDGQSDKWKIENSWGKENGHNGYYVASDSWFDSYVYQAVVHKKYLGDKALEALNTEAKLLDPWDPMGTLAD
ncbi:MAG: peptidase C1, partial [Erysipelotrichaceae bacterium]|nr:peptidase C1 [Erysipelotrichaceae bacterium]